MSNERIAFASDVETIQIPDGTPLLVPTGTTGWVMQVLGGNFTVRLETGHLVRVSGIDAEAIGHDVPEAARRPTSDPADFDEELVWNQLRTCYDPEIPVNIVDLGLIYGCEVSDLPTGKRIAIEMTLTAPGCGMGQVLKDDIEFKLRTVPGVEEVEVEVVFDPPWTPARMSEAAQLEIGYY